VQSRKIANSEIVRARRWWLWSAIKILLWITRASKHRTINPRGNLKTGARSIAWETEKEWTFPAYIGGGTRQGSPRRGSLRDHKGITKDYMKILLSS